jgi:hypothetical protein
MIKTLEDPLFEDELELSPDFVGDRVTVTDGCRVGEKVGDIGEDVGARVVKAASITSTEETLVTEAVIESESVVPEFKLVVTVDAKLEADDSPITVKSASMSQVTVQV